MRLVLNIEPKPQSRPRFASRGKFVTTYEDKTMKAWRKACTTLVQAAYRGEVLEGPVSLHAVFYVAPPQYIVKTKYLQDELHADKIYCYKKPDLDNYEKALYDSISDAGNVWKDDGQIAKAVLEKKYSLNPRIEVEVEVLP